MDVCGGAGGADGAVFWWEFISGLLFIVSICINDILCWYSCVCCAGGFGERVKLSICWYCSVIELGAWGLGMMMLSWAGVCWVWVVGFSVGFGCWDGDECCDAWSS